MAIAFHKFIGLPNSQKKRFVETFKNETYEDIIGLKLKPQIPDL